MGFFANALYFDDVNLMYLQRQGVSLCPAIGIENRPTNLSIHTLNRSWRVIKHKHETSPQMKPSHHRSDGC